MPELPEVEHLRRSLEPGLVGARFDEARLFRIDIVRPRTHRKPIAAGDLLEGSTVASLDRRGKQLAIIAASGRGITVQLGMSGQLRWAPDRGPDTGPEHAHDHVHARWKVRDARGRLRWLEFRDPRRFGGISPFASRDDLESRLWSRLGPDAVDVAADRLAESFLSAGHRSRRAVKSLLLDQSVVAGIGNIYADEALFAAGIHPRRFARSLNAAGSMRLALEIQRTLRAAISAGGSTLRDYVDATGRAGSFQETHRVYGRGGLDCLRCSATLRSGLVAGRTTVWCPACQPRSSRT